MNRRGQFSIIAALLVAVVLIGTVITTYAALRYSTSQDQPQVLSAIDETNLALEKVLGFTVGYYGSVLQVTGNTTYAKEHTADYLRNALGNMTDIQPEWGASFSLGTLDLSANWFTNSSYSAGQVVVNYNLTGLGISGMNYNTSCRLDVQVLNSSSSSKACLNIAKDGDEPLTNLDKENFKFYRYQYSNLTWEFEAPSGELTAFANGTYLIDIPPEIDPSSYVVQVTDARGIMVAAASFSRLTATLMWNTTSAVATADYVDNSTVNIGSQSNFTAQQHGPDGIYDNLTENVSGTALLSYYPSSFNLMGSTSNVSGTITDLQSDNGVYMQFRSYASMNGTQSTFGDTTQSGSSTTNTENTIVGSLFTITQNGWADSISAYVGVTSSAKNMKCMIYKHSDSSLVGTTQQVNVSIGTGWVTFNFTQPKPFLSANTEYVLVAWSASGSGSANLYYESGSSSQGHTQYYTYGTPPNTASFSHNNYQYAIYCNYTPPSEYTCEVEFTGTSNTQNWTQLTWTTDSKCTDGGVAVTFQLWNYQAGRYALSGEDGYNSTTIGTTDVTMTQTITDNSTYFRDDSGNWKIKFKAVKSTSSQFDMNIDLVRYSPESPDVPNYALDIEEQWTNVNYAYPRQDLCINASALGSENLVVDVWHDGAWVLNVAELTDLVGGWKNVSVTQYIDSSTFTIRFRGSNDASDPTQDSWNIDAVLLSPQPDVDALLKPIDHTIVVELLQNGTMRWLGQSLNLTTQKPIPPIPVKAIHVNQTINGVNQEVPFQVEDWASEYRIPLALTNNATVFSNRQMIVFLVNVNVSKVTVWWDGRDTATQTPLAYTNKYFTSDTAQRTVNNGILNLKIDFSTQDGVASFKVISTKIGSAVTATAVFMRINQTTAHYGWSEPAYAVLDGSVRAVLHHEVEWSGGISGCPNVYAHIVITLPANATYYTYQLRLIFVNSTDRPRTITDLCPIKLSTSLGSVTIQTENGTVNTSPIVANGTGTFINYSSGDAWTAHHWSQFISGAQGAGIMFTDSANQLLYAFDPNATAPTGSLNVSATTKTIEFSPVTQPLGQVSNFTTPDTYDITWHGAVATFNSTATPIYTLQGTAPSGLWLLVEYPPKITVTTES